MAKIKYKNSTIKLLALFISIVLWSYVRGEINPQVVREFKNIKVETRNENLVSDAGLILLEPIDVNISVKVSGRRDDINSLTKSDISAEVDLSGVSKGTHRVPIEVSVPFKVELEDISERYISYEVDNLGAIQKDVSIRTLGSSTSGHNIGQGNISPKTIKLSGPNSLLDKVSKVVINVDLNKLDSNGKMIFPVTAVDSKGKEVKGLDKKPSTVEATLILSKTKEVPVKPKFKGVLKPDYKISKVEINPSTVTIRGLDKDIKNITFIETSEIDLSEIINDKDIQSKLMLPKGIGLENNRGQVNVKIQIERTIIKQIEIPLEEVTMINIKEGLKSNIQDQIGQIIVTLKGNENVLSKLSSQDMKLKIDLNNLDEGVHNLKINLSVPENIEVQSINPNTLTVNVQKVE